MPRGEGCEGGVVVLVPGERGVLGLAEGADAGGVEDGEGVGEAVAEGVEGDAGEMLEFFAEGGMEIVGWPRFDVGDAVETADFDGGVGLVNDGPGSGVRAFPELALLWQGG
jgi:hypothetical protein